MAAQLRAIVKSIAQDLETPTAGSHAEPEPSIQAIVHTNPASDPNDTLPQDLASDNQALELDNFPDHEDNTTHLAAGNNAIDSESVTGQEDGVDQDHIQNHADALDRGFPRTFLSTLLDDEWPSTRASTATDDTHRTAATCEAHDAEKSMERVRVAAEMTSDHGTAEPRQGGGHVHGGDQHMLTESMAAATRYVAECMNVLAALVVELALRTHTVQTAVRNVICGTPVFGYVARLEGVECPGANVTHALTMYTNAQDTWQQLQGPVLELLPLSSLFTLAHNRLEDASFAVRYGRYPGCEQTEDAIESYATNVSNMGWTLEKYFHNITLVTEIMAINLDRAVSIMKEDEESTATSKRASTCAARILDRPIPQRRTSSRLA
ncbi:hypothetical protein LTS15_011262 [Exophiala xenobiotica]|nr:hypothetical protein LTS15_011262 [Exophiala xenobiotica]